MQGNGFAVSGLNLALILASVVTFAQGVEPSPFPNIKDTETFSRGDTVYVSYRDPRTGRIILTCRRNSDPPGIWTTPQVLNDRGDYNLPYSDASRALAQDGFVRLAKLPHGAAATMSPCFVMDMDHDGLMEFGMYCQDEVPVFQGWEIWKCIPPDSFVMVKQELDSWGDTTKPGIVPWGVGDVDGDGRTELVGITSSGEPDYIHYVATVESEDYYDYPSKLTWKGEYERGVVYFETPFRLANLDNDGKPDIVFVNGSLNTVLVYENVRNDSNRLVWSDTLTGKDYSLDNWVCGDFDGDGLTEFMSGGIWGDYIVLENTGADNKYHRIHTGAVSGCAYDVFSGKDIDGDGKPDFFISSISYTGEIPELWLYRGVGDNKYDSTLVGVSSWVSSSSGYSRSAVGDVDGDSLLEVVWSLRRRIILLDDAQHNYTQLGEWTNDHYGNCDQSLVTCADLNLDGKDEILVTGCFRTSILKWEGTGVEETITHTEPRFEVLSSIGPTITLRYSNCPNGFHAVVYDISGRKIEELHSNLTSGTLMWGEGQSPGVYFIVPKDDKVSSQKVILVK